MKNLSLVMLFILVSCGKKEFNQDESNKVQIIRALNSLQPDLALKLIETEKKEKGDDEEVRIYEASAYAIKAGIDVFTIFPILKIKLFNESIVNWDNLKKYDNPYMKFVVEETENENENNIEHRSGNNNNNYIDSMEENGQEIKVEGDEGREEEIEKADDESQDDLKDKALKITEELKNSNPVYSLIEDQDSDKNLGAAGIMKALWSIYEAIPLIIQSPLIEDSSKEHVSKIFSLLEDPKFVWKKKKDDKTYFLSYVSVIMVLSELKHIIDFKKISNPIHLICNMKPIEAGRRADSTLSYLDIAMKNLLQTKLVKSKKNKKALRNQANMIKKLLESQKNDDNLSGKLGDQLTIIKTNNCM